MNEGDHEDEDSERWDDSMTTKTSLAQQYNFHSFERGVKIGRCVVNCLQSTYIDANF